MALLKSNYPDPSLAVDGVEKVSKWRTSASSEKEWRLLPVVFKEKNIKP